MRHFKKGELSELKRIIVKNIITSHKKLLFEIVDYLSEFNIPEIKKNFMYSKEYIKAEMEEIFKNHGCFELIDIVDHNHFKSYHNFFNYNSEGKIYSMSDDVYFIKLLSCIDIIVDEVIKDPALLNI